MAKARKAKFIFILTNLVFQVNSQILAAGQLSKFGSRSSDQKDAESSSSQDSSSNPFSKESPTSESKKRSHFQTSLVELDEDYDFNVPPPTEDGRPVRVEFSINLRNILQVLEVEQLISIETTIRMMWNDTRARIKEEKDEDDEEAEVGFNKTNLEGLAKKNQLKPDYVTINPRLAKHFWIPDIFIDQAKQVREPTFHVLPASLRIYRNSMIRYAARINFDVACAMEFHNYPGDVQMCYVKLESFGYTEDQLVFKWSNKSDINENISLSQFSVKILTENGYKTDYYDKNYPGLILAVQLRRKLNYHLVQTYAPSTVYLTVSWLALFIPPNLVAERLAMSMTIMLTLTAMFASERQNVPRVSYVTCLDVWMFVCIFFVFLELSEFTIVLHLNQKQRKEDATKMEQFARISLPVLFFLFNMAYWPYLLSKHMAYH